MGTVLLLRLKFFSCQPEVTHIIMGKHGRSKEKEKRKSSRKEEKLKLKMMETPEEKRKRRLEKKARKHKGGSKDIVLAGYTNENNPFGDSNLTERFVWKLKEQKMEKEGKSVKESDAKRRIRTRLEEIEKVKERRKQREREKAEWEEEKARIQRDQDMMTHEDWEEQEKDFHLEQAKKRSQIRIEEGRAKPIDFLYRNLNCDDDEFDFSLGEPYLIFNNLSLDDLTELQQDINMYEEMSRNDDQKFWHALSIVCKSHIADLERKYELYQRGGEEGVEEGENTIREMDKIFVGKSYIQLQLLESDINKKIEAGGAIDTDYWHEVLNRLAVHKARVQLTDMHEKQLEKRLLHLEAAKAEEERRMIEEFGPDYVKEDAFDIDFAKMRGVKVETIDVDSNVEMLKIQRGGESSTAVEPPRHYAEDGRFSPELFSDFDEEEAVDPLEDELELLKSRKEILLREVERLTLTGTAEARAAAAAAALDPSAAAIEMYSQEQSRGFDENETLFGDEVPVDQTYGWNDKYRPRKPRYFNRVHTGFEWNKYNQTHYNHENPPPKIVQGYKFNIFYPDLIDKTNPPTYLIEPGESKEFKTLRFTAGPPYEDIAFQIVNREWEWSHKRGFKCQFRHGVMSLWFNFRRYRYRR